MLSPADGPLMHMVRLARDVGPPAASRSCATSSALPLHRRDGGAAGGTLSGGEKARLVLAMLVWQRPNLLLLDEPTNHLDLTTREALSVALNEFEGTVMLVSHDRALLREVCDEFWLVADGGVQPFDGDLDDYQRWLLEEAQAPRAKAAARKRTKAQASTRRDARARARAPRPPPQPHQRRAAGRRKEDRQGRGAGAPAAHRRGSRSQGVNRIDNRLGVLFADATRSRRPRRRRVDADAAAETGRAEGHRRGDRARSRPAGSTSAPNSTLLQNRSTDRPHP